MIKPLRVRDEVAICLAYKYGRITPEMLLEAIPIHQTRALEVLNKLCKRGFLERYNKGEQIIFKLKRIREDAR